MPVYGLGPYQLDFFLQMVIDNNLTLTNLPLSIV